MTVRMRTSPWVSAARPATLPAAIAPVLVGTMAAEGFVGWRLAAALVVALGFQVGVNFANDYDDGTRGIDTDARVGPRRAVASGLIAPARMRGAMALAFLVALTAGLALAAAVGWELLLVGAVCLLAALGYSGGPRPYASAGLGEAFVFLCFGLVATAGSAYVQDGVVVAHAWPAAVAMGAFASALLMVNNLRDLDSDARVGKRTLAVRLGQVGARRAYVGLLAVGFAMVPLVALLGGGWAALLALLVLPQAVLPIRAVLGGQAGHDLVEVLEATGRLQLVFGLLLALGFLLGG